MSLPDFKQLLEDYRKDKLDAQQKSAFEQLLHNEAYKPDLQRLVDESLKDISPVYAEHTQKYIYNCIREQYIEQETNLHSAPIHRIHFLRRGFFRYAAAVLIIICGVGGYFLLTNKKNDQSFANNNKQSQTDIAPGGNKAILVLADGSRIILDSAANGNLAQQGNAQIIKLANGQITYNLKGLAAGDVMMNTMTTPNGGQYQLTLPDGSKVWLNAASSITFPAVFVGSERKVKITGEAYFEVMKNKEKPFKVDIDGKSLVEVLGTSFNINSYSNEDAIKTTLIEGSVRISNNYGQRAILKPAQQINISLNPAAFSASSDPQLEIVSADIEQTLAWKNGIFNFDGLDVKSVMRQLERWYDIKVQYKGLMPNVVLTGGIYRKENLSFVLDMLKKTGVKCKLDGKTLIVL